MAKKAAKTIVNCGTNQVSVSIFSENAGTLVLEKMSILPYEYDEATGTGWNFALRELFKKNPPQGEVIAIVPAQHLITKQVKIPVVEKEKRAQVVEFEAQNNLTFNHKLEELSWGSQSLSSDGIEEEIILFALPLSTAKKFTEDVKSCGVMPDLIVPSTNLDVQTFNYVSRFSENEGPLLIVNVGPQTTVLTFVCEDLLNIGINQIALGGSYISQKIAETVGKEPRAVEPLKNAFFRGESVPANERKFVEEAVEAFIRRLSQELTRRVINFKREKKAGNLKKILVTGTAIPPNFTEKLSELQRVPVEIVNVSENISLPGGLDLDDQSVISEINEAAGAAISLISPEIVPVNLLPPEILEAAEFRKKIPFFVAAGILFAAAPWPIWLHVQESAKLVAAEAKAQTQAVKIYEEREKALKDFEKENSERSERVAKLNASLKDRFAWNEFFAELQKSLGILQAPKRVDEDGEKVFAVDRHIWVDELKVERRRFVPAKEAVDDEAGVPEGVATEVLVRFVLLMPEVSAVDPVFNDKLFSLRVGEIERAIKSCEFVDAETVKTEPDFKKANVPVLSVRFRVKEGKGL